VPTSELTLSYEDDISGTIRGYRIFTACRTYRGKIFRLEDHLDRLFTFAAAIYMQPPLSRDSLRNLLLDLVDRNLKLVTKGDLLIDVVFSGGLAGSTMKQSGQGAHLYVVVQELVPPPAAWYERGMVLATFPHQRMYPDVKLLNYVGAILGHQTVVPEFEADEVLFVDPADRATILEGSTFTVFFADSTGRIVTPPLDGRILDSITRRVVLEILKPLHEFTIQEIPVSLNQISSFPEAFLASTTRNVVPVTRINRSVIGTGRPGTVTKAVMNLFREYLDAY
jgi:branched-chain amino acid aminotransferase